MRKHIIKDFDSLKNYFSTLNRPFFAVNKYPYNPLIGIENFLKNFEILAFLNSKEADVIEKKRKVSFVLGGKLRSNVNAEDDPVMRSIYHQIGRDENKSTISILKDNDIIRHLQSFREKPVLLVYRMSKGLVNAVAGHNWTVVGSDYNVREKHDNKTDFNSMLEALDLPVPPYVVLSQEDIDCCKILTSLGDKLVIQFPISYSGSGTFIIHSEQDFYKTIASERFQKQKEKNAFGKVKISQYVNRKLSPVMGVCCTQEGTVYTDLYHQIIDAPEVVHQMKGSGI